MNDDTTATTTDATEPKAATATPTRFQRLHSHTNTPPPGPFRREILLTLTTIQTGILDAAIYASLGRVFVANMTGNIVLLGLAIATLRFDADFLPTCVSLVAFFIGGMLTGILERLTRQQDGSHTRLFFTTMTLVDSILNFTSAALIYTNVIQTQATGEMRLIIFGLLATGQGSQLVLTKRAGLPAFANAVITNTYVDLSTDPHLFHIWGPGTRERNRRAISILSLLAGAVIGAEICKFYGLGIALFIGAGLSCITAIGWIL
jgi:uncharacterized membrane protein YoaK (UPF0700 family)